MIGRRNSRIILSLTIIKTYGDLTIIDAAKKLTFFDRKSYISAKFGMNTNLKHSTLGTAIRKIKINLI